MWFHSRPICRRDILTKLNLMDWIKEKLAHRRHGPPQGRPASKSLTPDSKIKTVPSDAREENGEVSPNNSKVDHHASEPEPVDLWGQALHRLSQQNAKLVNEYRTVLIEEGQKDGDTSTVQVLGNLVTSKLDKIEKVRFKYTFNGKKHSVNEQFGKLIQGILGLKEYITVAVSPDPHASLAWSGVLVVLPILLRPWTEEDEVRDGFAYIVDYLIRCKVIEDEYKKAHSNRFLATDRTSEFNRQSLHEAYTEKMIELYKQILEYQIRFLHHLSRSGFIRVFADLSQKDGWKSLKSSIETIEKDIVVILDDLDRVTIHNIDQGVEAIYEFGEQALRMLEDMQGDVKFLKEGYDLEKIDRSLERLSQLYVMNASFESELRHRTCLPGTRETLFDKIGKWTKDRQGQQIFWVNGVAGTGKSTIAKSVASNLAKQGRLGASYFFESGTERGSAQLIFRTIAVQIAQSQEVMRHYIADAVDHNPGIDDFTLEQQWSKLLHEPLKKCVLLEPIFIVIDALDECDEEIEIEMVLRCLSHIRDLPNFRIFITSRPGLTRYFHGIGNSILQVNISEVDGTDGDISKFLRYRLGEIRERWGEKDEDWPEQSALVTLERKAEKLFIYASMACSFIDSFYYKDRLSEILESDRPGLSLLNNLYTKALEKALPPDLRPGEEQKFLTSFCKIIGTIVCLFQPLTVRSLEQLLGQEDVKSYVSRVSSVLSVAGTDEPIRVFHLSFRNFFVDADRDDKTFWADEEEIHALLASRCAEILCTTLDNSIFDLQKHGSTSQDISIDKLNQYLPPHAQYACLNFARHVMESKNNITSQRALKLMNDRLLPWANALVLLQKFQLTTQGSTAQASIGNTIDFASDYGDHTKRLLQLAGEKKDYYTLKLLLSIMWKSESLMTQLEHARRIGVGRLLISAHYLCGDLIPALHLSEDITYNLRRVFGKGCTQAWDMMITSCQLYISIGKELDAQDWKRQSVNYKTAVNILFSWIQGAEQLDDEIADRIRRCWHMLRLSAQRLGSIPRDRSDFEGVKATIDDRYPGLLGSDDELDEWNVESFGFGKAESDYDLFVPELNFELLSDKFH
ncbi:hypothetical protein ASPBRDRAFT_188620 [Aspergillus brasiliensis CBS 101740]|uniref:NACHT domain-containing protein n=1 Tax=Aspergillus brasiliensis (strain CBS 101740 / IMI 381727 / IBT 21946) TaxID=767769 RepID=A0A1L9U3P4_ASPBC|nr:hypothetical protein ASPBRDRAFT_188620 [Aspergillus brasiliensis CBS 101740]